MTEQNFGKEMVRVLDPEYAHEANGTPPGSVPAVAVGAATSPTVGAIAAALSKAQASFPAIPKDRSVTVKTESAGTYSFDYATLDGILTCVRPALAENGLALTSCGGEHERGLLIVTRLLHSSGEWLKTEVLLPFPAKYTSQAIGSAITYGRRYGVCELLCIAADEDDDGGAASGHQTTKNERPVKRPLAKAPPAAPAPLSAAPAAKVDQPTPAASVAPNRPPEPNKVDQPTPAASVAPNRPPEPKDAFLDGLSWPTTHDEWLELISQADSVGKLTTYWNAILGQGDKWQSAGKDRLREACTKRKQQLVTQGRAA